VRSLRNAAPLTDPSFRAHRSSLRETTECFPAGEVMKKEEKRKGRETRDREKEEARYLTRRKARRDRIGIAE